MISTTDRARERYLVGPDRIQVRCQGRPVVAMGATQVDHISDRCYGRPATALALL